MGRYEVDVVMVPTVPLCEGPVVGPQAGVSPVREEDASAVVLLAEDPKADLANDATAPDGLVC